jgi:hypothetical protein
VDKNAKRRVRVLCVDRGGRSPKLDINNLEIKSVIKALQMGLGVITQPINKRNDP